MYFEKYIERPDILIKLGVDEELAKKIASTSNILGAEKILINACMALVDIELNDGLISVEDVPKRLQELSGYDFSVGNFTTRWVHQA